MEDKLNQFIQKNSPTSAEQESSWQRIRVAIQSGETEEESVFTGNFRGILGGLGKNLFSNAAVAGLASVSLILLTAIVVFVANIGNPSTEYVNGGYYADVKLSNQINFIYADSCQDLSSKMTNYYKKINELGLYYVDVGNSPMPRITPTSMPDVPLDYDSKDDSKDYFTDTNVQTKGVDEGDKIKTDGEYIFTLNDEKREVIVTKVDPVSNAKVLSRVVLPKNYTPNSMLLDGDRLIVFASSFFQEKNKKSPEAIVPSSESIDRRSPSVGLVTNTTTAMFVYDISDKLSLKLLKVHEIEGSLKTTRKMNGVVYLITESNLFRYFPQTNENVDVGSLIPAIMKIDKDSQNFRQGNTNKLFSRSTDCSDIAITSDDYVRPELTSILSLNLKGDLENEKVHMFAGTNGTVYMSNSNLYFGSEEYDFSALSEKEPESNALNSILRRRENVAQRLKITKAQIDGDEITFKGAANLQGHLVNQFAMDEKDGFLRIAATTKPNTDSSENYIAVLDSKLNLASEIGGLAKSEKIYSARFSGNTGLVVTFKKVDPLFVFDLSDPYNIELRGELKIPGYSDYLHFVTDDIVIGIGKDAEVVNSEYEEGRTIAYYQGIKVAMFDISDAANPRQLSNLILGDRGSESDVLSNHLAFTFDSVHDRIIFPASIAEVRESECSGQIASCYGETVSSGMQVISLKNSDGDFELKLVKEISHKDEIPSRAIVIGNSIFTVSEGEMLITSGENYSLIKQLDLQE